MTNSYDVDHGLSQDEPGPLEPVEIAQQPGAAPATGNTARDQEMYAAGIRTGEENAKHNAAIRAGVHQRPARDWELTCHECDGSGHVYVKHQVAERKTDIQEFKQECECCEGRGFVFAFQDIPGIGDYVKACRPASSAPGVSTVEDERQAFEAWAKRKKMPLARIGEQYDDFWVDHAWNGWQARAALAAPAAGDAQTAAARDVLAERQRQISVEGWTPGDDDLHRNGELAEASAAYAQEAAAPCGGLPMGWPWAMHWWKPTTPRRNLVKAGALILAEIERLDRAAQRKGDA